MWQPAGPKIDLDAWPGDLDIELLYQDQIRQYPALTVEEEVELAKRIEVGLYAGHKLLQTQQASEKALPPSLRKDLQILEQEGRAAKELFIASNLRLVMKFARKYKFRLPFMDAVQCGNLGLMAAVNKFDYRKQLKFSTMAAWWIRQAIQQGRRSSYSFELSKQNLQDLDSLRIAENDLFTEQSMQPTLRQLMKKTSFTRERIEELNGLSNFQVPFDAPVKQDSRLTLAEVLPHEAPDAENFRATDGIAGAAEEIFAVMRNPATYCGNEPERQIIDLRWGLQDGRQRTLAEVSEILDMPRSMVAHNERKASRKVAEALIRLGYELPHGREFILDLRGARRN